VQPEGRNFMKQQNPKRRNLRVREDVASATTQQYNASAAKMSDRQFRDAVTKVTPAVRGVPTNAIQWGRWTP
jgi:hypothetical protein